MASRAMERPVVVLLDIGEALIPCAGMPWVVHAQNVYDHPDNDLFLAISMGMERCGLSELEVQHWSETIQKCYEELSILICDDRLWDPKVYPHSFKEEFSSGFGCDTLLAGLHNGHLRESANDHKNIVISMLSRRKAWHVIHGDGFPRSTRGRQRNIETLLLDGRFGNGTGSVGSVVLPDVLSKIQPIEILL